MIRDERGVVRRAVAIRPESMAMVRERCENLSTEEKAVLRRGTPMQRMIAAMADASLTRVLQTPAGVRLPDRLPEETIHR